MKWVRKTSLLYINKKYITIFSIIILAIILLYNFFTCPDYIISAGFDSFNRSLIWCEKSRIKFNSTVVHYSGFLGGADFGLIAYFYAPIHITNPREILHVTVLVVKISEKTYNPLVKGFAIDIEGVTLFDYLNDTNIHIYAYTGSKSKTSSFNNSTYFYYDIKHMYDYLPKTLYVRIDYAVHVIINPYAKIWYSEFKYITTGFHVKVYSGSLMIPITIIPE
ncbi:MAG: hypothetical protein NDF51_02060 [archaeon YNP-WB-040]|nr:hypothetical protein [Candidatus Culexarchaeum yellowstonense]